MHQTLFTIPFTHIPIYGYGVMLVIGFIAAMYLAQFLARHSRLDPEIFANAAILALVSGILGARLSHVLENLPQYTDAHNTAWQNFYNAINIREGGLTYYGGFLLAFPTLVLYAIGKKVPLPLGMDIIAPCLMVGLGFGRIGCYLNGCCYGAECQASFAVQFPYGSDAYVTEFNQKVLKQPVPRALIRDGTPLADYMDVKGLRELDVSALKAEDFETFRGPGSLKNNEQVKNEGLEAAAAGQKANPVHPAEIYSAVTAFLLAVFLVAAFALPHVPGRVFAGMMMVEGVFRYLLEMLRVEPAVIGGHDPMNPGKLLPLSFLPPQSYSMVVSFGLVVGGAVLWYVFGRNAQGRAETGNPLAQPARV
ncbi:MAG: prolipoprotein diacylglyceryl transferase [Phycisphaerales bacterium]|nr:prolipoprotein diacylglyceryl transferase [Phycisphaerales bacterium]